MKRITFVSSPTAGGAERMTLLYAKILKKHGYDCHILMTKYKGNKVLLPDFIPTNISQSIIKNLYGWLLPYQMALNIFLLNPAIVFCSQPGNTKKLLKMKRLGFIRSKIVFRDFLMPHDQVAGINEETKLFDLADACIAQTEEMKEEMVQYYGLKPGKIIVVNNPIDKDLIEQKIKEVYPFDHNYTNYIAINRVDPQKDLETLIRAFAIVVEKNPKSRLYICGNDSNKEYLEDMKLLARELCVQDKVFFEGPQSNPFKYLYYADVFVLSSIYEGLPNGMLEAMYLGIPVVVTRSIPFVSQVVKEGVHGYTTETKDYKAFGESMLKAKDMKIYDKFIDITNSEETICSLFDRLTNQ